MCSPYPLYSISNVQPHSHAFSFLAHNPISVRLTYAMRASFFATLVVAASAIFPALSTPLGYVVVPLNPAIPTDLFFVVYAAASLTSLRAISHLPHVTPPLSSRRGTAARTTALGALLLYVSPGLRIMRMTESLARKFTVGFVCESEFLCCFSNNYSQSDFEEWRLDFSST